MQDRARLSVIISLSSPVFLGMAPLFGKLAYQSGADPFTVAAVRTVIAAAILWLLYAIFWRRYIYIYPAGLMGCIVLGTVNGIGSLMFYTGLNLLDASLTQLLNGMYIAFAVLMTRLFGQQVTFRTTVRVLLALVALMMLTGMSATSVSWLGVGLMLGNAIMFAGTVLLSQRVLFEMPAQTVTLYTLSTMAVIVTMVRIGYGIYAPSWEVTPAAMWAIIALGLSTALARLTMFLGVKTLGGLQTAIIAMTEIGVTLVLAFLFLGERLAPAQWIGVAFLAVSILAMRKDENPEGVSRDATSLPNMAGLTLFHQIAFDQAFGTGDVEVTPEELEAIRRMMGASAELPAPPKPKRLDELPTAPKPANTASQDDSSGAVSAQTR